MTKLKEISLHRLSSEIVLGSYIYNYIPDSDTETDKHICYIGINFNHIADLLFVNNCKPQENLRVVIRLIIVNQCDNILDEYEREHHLLIKNKKEVINEIVTEIEHLFETMFSGRFELQKQKWCR
jgi:hypothetical protein